MAVDIADDACHYWLGVFGDSGSTAVRWTGPSSPLVAVVSQVIVAPCMPVQSSPSNAVIIDCRLLGLCI